MVKTRWKHRVFGYLDRYYYFAAVWTRSISAAYRSPRVRPPTNP